MNCNKNPQKIKAMFDNISQYYDVMNNLISLGTHYLIKNLCIKLLNIKPESMTLDLCCGTGDFAKIISKQYPKAKVIGLDHSVEMIKLAKQKIPNKAFMLGDCTQLPFSDNEFDYITMGFGLRNIENRQKAISEAYRVLKDNGKFLHLDFGYHNKLSKIFDFIVPIAAKILNKDEKSYKYLIDSKNTFPEPDELINEFTNAGFNFVQKRDYLFGTISCQIMSK